METAHWALIAARINIQDIDESMFRSVLAGLLTMSDDGVLITDLEHNALACNAVFGQIFLVDPAEVPGMEVERLRGYVYPRLKDPNSWRDQIEEIYTSPHRVHQDELELVGPERAVLRRKSGPLFGQENEIVGRWWTFKDITREFRYQQLREAVYEISTFHHPDPNVVCRRVTELVGRVYESAAILSIRQDDVMWFREVANMPPGFEQLRSNPLSESFCQFALRDRKPLLVQDALTDEALRCMNVVKAGFRRVLSAPIMNMEGEPIGTICFLDGKCEEVCGPADVEFMTVMANRIATEIERERSYLARTAEQRRALEVQSIQLEHTREVLEAMNSAFEYLIEEPSENEILEKQVDLLYGLLGFRSCALFVVHDHQAEGFIRTEHGIEKAILTGREAVPITAVVKNTSVTTRREFNPNSKLSALLGDPQHLLAHVHHSPRPLVLVLGGQQLSELPESMISTYLTAIVEQISLVTRVCELQDELRDAYHVLSQTQTRLVHVEKLSIVGALAASIAHDIRNILAAIGLECSLGGPAEETVRNLQKQTDRFKVLSHRLLGYVTPKVLAREEVDLIDTFERATSLLQSQMRISGVTFTQNVDAHLPTIIADSHRIEHLFVNLLLNAIQSIGTTGGRLSLVAKVDAEWIRVSIQDNGRGISPEIQEKIFDAFMSSRGDGVGLGLYSCKQIIDEHGWKIEVESTLSIGTMFTVLIPLN